VPGLVVDRYGDHVVFQVLTAGLERRRELVIEELTRRFDPACLYERSDVTTREYEGLPLRAECVRGTLNPDLAVQLDDVVVSVDVAKGQKTGLFLDQVDNWRIARRYARGRRVLDCFCYPGGWSVWWGRGGAAECIGIDSSERVVERAAADARRNGLGDACRFERGDAFETLRGYEQAGRRFDLAVVDPPAFAKNRKQVRDAQRGYRELNLRALRLLAPGGILFTCSCSYHISPEMFDEILLLAARDAGRTVRVLPGPGQGHDHPVLLSTPETRYLKVRALEVVEG
jgi:23S rRNA (cytosine1962-C5)-methyltransferase